MNKELNLALYESSLLTQMGVTLADGWDAISESYSQPEIVSFFEGLSSAMRNGTFSFEVFTASKALENNFVVACYFAELASVAGVFDTAWSDMATAYLLKQKLSLHEATKADVQVAAYLLRSADELGGYSLRKEITSWFSTKKLQIPEKSEEIDSIPDAWWSSFEIKEADSEHSQTSLPRTIETMREAGRLGGNLDSAIPPIIEQWTRFASAASSVY